MANLEGLHPYVKQQAEKLVENASKRISKGKHKVIITQGYRSIAEQNKLYAQGRTTPGNIVTDAIGGQSMHNFGLAIDFALATLDGKKATWDTIADFDKDGKADWMEVVSEAFSLGFDWGGTWKSFKDMPHFQMLGGLSEKEVRAGKEPYFSDFDKKITIVKEASVKKETSSAIPKAPILSIIEGIQIALNKKYKANIELDGKYGDATKKALIKGLQTEVNKVNDIDVKVDGVWGKKTKESCTSIRLNATGNYVWVAQAILNCLGYDTNGIDGIFGQGTSKAVLKFQKDHGLGQDGIINKNTFEILFK